MLRLIASIFIALMLVACASKKNFAPVVNANEYPSYQIATGVHTQSIKQTPVIVGTSLPIAAKKSSQKIMLTPPPKKSVAHTSAPVAHTQHAVEVPKKTILAEKAPKKSGWPWPVKGHLIQKFSDKNPGINIQAAVGDPVYAVAQGQVVYSEHNVGDYGNLLIIKQSDGLLTAYAHNQNLFVNVGDAVMQGEKIATVGAVSHATQGVLYFEVRKAGKPVDPLTYLS
jgi:lipoprotein NlpD